MQETGLDSLLLTDTPPMAKRKKSTLHSGRMTPPTRSRWDRSSLRRLAGVHGDNRLTLKWQPRQRLQEDLRHVPKQIRKRDAFTTVDGVPAQIVEGPSKVHGAGLSAPLHSRFSDPARTEVCIRRQARRRVLFALQKAGRGRRVSSDRRFTEKSYVRCK